MKYVSKPTECDAMQWTIGVGPGETQQYASQIVAWVNANGGEARYVPQNVVHEFGLQRIDREAIAIRTINGWAYAAPGHYIVMGIATLPNPADGDPRYYVHELLRDFYPCDPETFERRWGLA